MPGLYEQALVALERGHGAEAASHLVRALKQPGLPRDDQIQIRCALAEAWLLQDDLRQAADALGKPPEVRERLDPARLSDLWRLHGRIAVSSGETSRGIAFLTKALKQAERAHDSRAIGLAHYELGHCYRQVGDTAIVREHLTSSASALHAAGDRRHLAMVHSLSGVALAKEGRLDEAMAALRQAERLAVIAEAGDVLATVCGNQANVALMLHRHDQALSLAERRSRLLAPEALLGSRPRLTLEAQVAAKFRHGQTVSVGSASGSVAVFGEDGMFLGTGEVDASGMLQPKRLLALR